jgi:hypothetical protein
VNEPKKKTYQKKLPFYVGEISQLGEEKIYKKTEFGVSCCHKFRKNCKTFTSHFYFHNSFLAKFGQAFLWMIAILAPSQNCLKKHQQEGLY